MTTGYGKNTSDVILQSSGRTSWNTQRVIMGTWCELPAEGGKPSNHTADSSGRWPRSACFYCFCSSMLRCVSFTSWLLWSQSLSIFPVFNFCCSYQCYGFCINACLFSTQNLLLISNGRNYKVLHTFQA